MGARTLSLVVQVMTSYYSTMFIVDVVSIIPVDLLLLLPEQPISGPHHANDSDVAALQARPRESDASPRCLCRFPVVHALELPQLRPFFLPSPCHRWPSPAVTECLARILRLLPIVRLVNHVMSWSSESILKAFSVRALHVVASRSSISSVLQTRRAAHAGDHSVSTLHSS